MVSLRPQHNVEEENQLLSFFSFLLNIRVILQEQVVSKEIADKNIQDNSWEIMKYKFLGSIVCLK